MKVTPTAQAERIAALEVKVELLTQDIQSMNQKLDSLLALRDKGAGAFWLASTLVGTSIVGAVAVFVQWLKG